MKKTAVFLDTGLFETFGGKHQTRIGREEIGAQLVAACVEKFSGWDVRFMRPNTTDVEQIVKEVMHGPCNALVLFPYTYTKWLADEVAKEFKGKVPIIYGGHHAGVGAMSQKIIDEGLADFVVAGRADEALPRLLKDLGAGKCCMEKIYRHDHSLPVANQLYPLEHLPWPIRDERFMQDLSVDPLPFLPPLNLVKDPTRCIVVAGSFGCNGRCDFCTSWKISPMALHRSPRSVVDEMEWLNKTYASGRAVFHIINPLFNADREWVMDLCAEMEKRGPFPTICMPDFRLDLEMVQAMKRAGIFMAMMGLEFADNDTRTKRGKRSGGDPSVAYELCDEVGIITRAFFMLGRCGMTEDELEAEVRVLNDLPFRADQLRINFEVPFPGSVIAGRCKSGDVIIEEKMMTTEHVAYQTGLSEEKWQQLRFEIMKSYHYHQRQLRHYDMKIRRHPELEIPIRDFLKRNK